MDAVISAGMRPLLLMAVVVLKALTAISSARPDIKWPTYGNDPGGSRYVDLDQITAADAGDLGIAYLGSRPCRT